MPNPPGLPFAGLERCRWPIIFKPEFHCQCAPESAMMMMMSFIVLSETKTSIPPYALWGTLHHEKKIKHM